MLKEEQVVQWKGIREHEAGKVWGDRITEGNTSKNPTEGQKERKPFPAIVIINYVLEEMMPKACLSHKYWNEDSEKLKFL